MSIREITNRRGRKPVCYGMEITINEDGSKNARVVNIYPGDDLEDAVWRDAKCNNFFIYDKKSDALREAAEINR